MMPGAPSCFCGFTGRGVRIAVIDSGIHPDHDHIDASRLGPGVSVFPDGSIDAGENATLDRLGHGTAVTAAIQEKAPDAICLPVRVFDAALRTSTAAILSAIRWSIAHEADIINLSLGSSNVTHREPFAFAVKAAIEAGSAIVAAHDNDGTPCYPGGLADAIGVGLDWRCPRTQYRATQKDNTVVFLASGYPRPIPGVPAQRNLSGVSFAVAQMTGFVARACEKLTRKPRNPTIEDIRESLRAEAATVGEEEGRPDQAD